MAQIPTSGQTNRFRRYGEYDWDLLLKDLRDLDTEVRNLLTEANGGGLGLPGPSGPRGLPGVPGDSGPRGLPGVFDESALAFLNLGGFNGDLTDFIRALNWALSESSVSEETADHPFDFGFTPIDCGLLLNEPINTVDLGVFDADA